MMLLGRKLDSKWDEKRYTQVSGYGCDADTVFRVEGEKRAFLPHVLLVSLFLARAI